MLVQGDARRLPLQDGCVQTVVTSPPYWGLRDYGHAGQIGLEGTPEEYVQHLVDVFREVRRVLREDGTVWLNLGDSYAGGGYSNHDVNGPDWKAAMNGDKRRSRQQDMRNALAPLKIKPKDLVGIPWMVAFALRADGWYLRSDIIWAKPNPMPESVTDRPTKAHEYLFLLTKGTWKTRVVQFSDLPSQVLHFGQHLGAQTGYAGFEALCVSLATTIFDYAQRQQQFSLPPFYAEEWQQVANDVDRDGVGSRPVEQGAAALCTRLLTAQVSPKQFVQQLHRLLVALPDGHNLLVRGIPSVAFGPPSVYRDADGAVAIYDAGKICKVDFRQGHAAIVRQSGSSYYYDHEGSKEPAAEPDRRRADRFGGNKHNATKHSDQSTFVGSATRNRRSVWTITTKPYAGAHFATFPPDLVEPCVIAGTPEGGCCAACRTPFRRLIEKGAPNREQQAACGADASGGYTGQAQKDYASANAQDPSATKARILAGMVERRTVGWQPQCRCGSPAVPSLVLDPFVGSGTVVAVAERLGRRGVGVELKGAYLALAQERLRGVSRTSPRPSRVGETVAPVSLPALSPATRPSFLRRFR